MCEAEYMALATTIKEALYLTQLLKDMDCSFQEALTQIFEDNQGTIRLAKNPVNRQRSKYVDTEYHFIRSTVLEGKVKLVCYPTENIVADVFTKSNTKFQNGKVRHICLVHNVTIDLSDIIEWGCMSVMSVTIRSLFDYVIT